LSFQLAYFSYHNVLKVHPYCKSVRISFLLCWVICHYGVDRICLFIQSLALLTWSSFFAAFISVLSRLYLATIFRNILCHLDWPCSTKRSKGTWMFGRSSHLFPSPLTT
jgi:hypothetical protein